MNLSDLDHEIHEQLKASGLKFEYFIGADDGVMTSDHYALKLLMPNIALKAISSPTQSDLDSLPADDFPHLTIYAGTFKSFDERYRWNEHRLSNVGHARKALGLPYHSYAYGTPQPYVYVLHWHANDVGYIGMQNGGTAYSHLLWCDYHTSSRYVYRQLVEYGLPTTTKIIPCKSGAEARALEIQYQTKYDVVNNSLWLNRKIG